MKMGTRSLLFGAHCFFLHPWFVAWAWWKLYGFPWDPRLWVAFLIHDWGYWGLDNMDGTEGEEHPNWAALKMHQWFDTKEYSLRGWRWFSFMRYHSRFLAKKDRRPISRLCVADKLAIALTPWWLYLPMVRLTGEIREYRSVPKHIEDLQWSHESTTWEYDRQWFEAMKRRMLEFAFTHKYDTDQDHEQTRIQHRNSDTAAVGRHIGG